MLSAAVATNCRYLTPVPGGVGPMTVACLLEQVVEAASRLSNRAAQFKRTLETSGTGDRCVLSRLKRTVATN